MPAITLKRVAVQKDRIAFVVQLAPGFRYTTPYVISCATELCPSLASHPCKNDSGPLFGDIAEHTPLSHLVEHMVIELQTRDSRTPQTALFTGTTTWIDEAEGLSRIEVSYLDDLVALAAYREAENYINTALANAVF